MKNKADYQEKKPVSWVCVKCGNKHGERRAWVSTWHEGKCDICGETDGVTEGRDYGIYEKQS